jgi:hypothetical protein
MSLAEQYLHPGPAPQKPPPGHATPQHNVYNDWVKKLRQHTVAKAVDALVAQLQSGTPLTPEQDIAAVLGRAYLEDALSSHGGILAGLF